MAWIQRTSRVYKQFVSSRVGEIRRNSDPKQWRHIPSESNVADDVSRGTAVQELNKRWLQGPEFLRMTSDNGTQLVGAVAELRNMVRGLDAKKLREFSAERGMEWRFITPGAPHQNDCAEALVKSVKIALKKAIGETTLTPFELYTLLLEVANLVNERPIGRIPNDPDDGAYICPNDMLLGRASSQVPQGPFKETNDPPKRVEFVQRIVDSFWRRWTRDYSINYACIFGRTHVNKYGGRYIKLRRETL